MSAPPARASGDRRPESPRASALVELARAHVTPRFALTLEEFVARLSARRVAAAARPGADGGGAGTDAADRAAGQPRQWLDDLYLATACADGDETAWRELEQRFFGFLRSFARRFPLGEEAADDVADATIADLWRKRKIERYEGRSTLKTWLGALVTHAALSAAEAQRRRTMALAGRGTRPGGEPAPVAGEREGAERAVREAASAALRAIPARDRVLVLLHYEQGLTLEEIAQVDGTSKATVSRSLKRVRERLHADIEDRLAAEQGASWRDLRGSLDLSRLDLDLPSLLGR